MLSLPFGPDRFDVAWAQHTFMNIEDKHRLLAQIHRVLKPDGILALYEILSGEVAPIHYPTQWASDPTINFLLSEEKLICRLQEAGFENLRWQDATTACTEWFTAVVDKMTQRATDAPTPIGLNLIIGPSAADKARNTARNLLEKRIRVVYGVFQKK
jgi:ubiquinone/menaquinone biosynthesis C-methylase UbiE